MPVIAGVNLSKANAEKLARAAIESGENHGYCDEVNNILEELGFDVPKRKITVTLEVTLMDVPFMFDEFDDLSDFHLIVDTTGYRLGDAYVDNVRQIKVTK